MPQNRHTRGFYTTNSSGGDYTHGQPVAEENVAGIAIKQAGTGFDTTIAQQNVIADGEDFYIKAQGFVSVDGTFNQGDELYIDDTTGLLVTDGYSEEVQTIAVDATGGTFTLTFSGQTTSAIAYNASAATVLAALEALSNLAPGDLMVLKPSAGNYTVSFSGAYADTNVPQMTASGASLTGGAGTVTIATTTAGGASTGVPFGTVVDTGRAPVGEVIVDLDEKP